MRPYLLLMTVVLMAAVLAPSAAFGQQPYAGSCFYGCGPYIPRLTVPELSLQQVSPNPVGASNATTGLIAGATNSTLSEVQGSTSSVYTEAVWLQGGDFPLITHNIDLSPETIGREGHPMHEAMRGEHPPEARMREEHGAREGQGRGTWAYFTGPEPTDAAQAASEANGGKKAARTYTNDDVTRQNDKNGMVKYDGKTEKM